MAISKIKTGSIQDNTVTGDDIQDGAVTNAKVNACAAVAQSKVSGLSTSISNLCSSITTLDGKIGTAANNIALLGFKMAVNDGLTVFNLIDGVVDEFNDESGTDEAEGSNDNYCGTSDFYSNNIATQSSVFDFDSNPGGAGPGTFGKNQTFTASRDGNAEILLWGAAGGSGGNQSPGGSDSTGGAGGFTRVVVPVSEGDTLNVLVGKGGANADTAKNDGGGLSGVFNTFSSSPFYNCGYLPICNAVAIAGGGGGGRHSGGAGGGVTGEDGNGIIPTPDSAFGNGIAEGGSQSNGGSNATFPSAETNAQHLYGAGTQGKGSYGLGGGGTTPQAPSPYTGGGGGGYYGGGGAEDSCNSGGGGGSGYIGGHPAYSVTEAVTITGAHNRTAYTGVTTGLAPVPNTSLTAPQMQFTYSPDAPCGAGMPTIFDGVNDSLSAHPQYSSFTPDSPNQVALARVFNSPATSAGGPGGAVINLLGESNTSMTVISSAFSSNSVATSGRIVVFAEIGSEVLNTDFAASVSRDAGVTFTNATLTDSGYVTGSSGQKIFTGTADISGQPSGQSMRYKITGSSLGSQVKIHGVALQWS